jgi:hypothetical protein
MVAAHGTATPLVIEKSIRTTCRRSEARLVRDFLLNFDLRHLSSTKSKN